MPVECIYFKKKNEKENENFVNPFLHCIALPDWLIVYCLRRKFKSVALYGPSNSDFNSVIAPRSAHDYGYNSFNEIYFRDFFFQIHIKNISNEL